MHFANNVKVMAGQTSPEDALAAGSYPASGSFVDVSGFGHVSVVVHLGAVHASDAPVFEIKQADAADGTEDTLDATNCKKTFLHSDDDQALIIDINTDVLATDHHFLSCVVSGVTNGSYGDILYLLSDPRKAPVTQSTTLIPSDNQLEKM